MKSEVRLIAVVGLVLVLVAGCDCWRQSRRPDPSPLGTLSDPIWQTQETNAEHSDFVIYQHEFKKDSEVLNLGGEDHVKEIAARLLGGQEAKVVVERSMMSSRPDTEYKYPVHPNPKLDLRRREIVVRSLTAMGGERRGPARAGGAGPGDRNHGERGGGRVPSGHERGPVGLVRDGRHGRLRRLHVPRRFLTTPGRRQAQALNAPRIVGRSILS